MTAVRKAPGRSPDGVEFDRIFALPIRDGIDAEDLEIESFYRLNAEAFANGDRLLKAQAMAVREYERLRGCLMPVPAGAGKTGIFLMIAQIAFAKGWAKKALLLVPVHLMNGLHKRHIPEWRRRTNLSLTFHYVGGKSAAVRQRICASGAPGVYVYPYSLMSRDDTVENLLAIDPDLVLADECHRLKNFGSALTKKWWHVMQTRQPKPDFVGGSGTLTKKHLMDYHHLVWAALGDKAPMPESRGMAYRWGLALDADASPTPAILASVAAPFVSWACKNFPDQRDQFTTGMAMDRARKAYRQRFNTTPGIVFTPDDRPDASLVISNLDVPEPSPALVEYARRVKEQFITPNGEELDHAIHAYKWSRELSSGFYNSLVWPEVGAHAKNRRISEQDAAAALAGAKEHLRALQQYRSLLREFFKDSPIGLDTPTEVAMEISRNGAARVDREIVDAWRHVHDLDFPGRPDRLEIPVRVDDFKIRRALQWAQEYKTGIVWVFHEEVGIWLMEVLEQAGLDPVYCPSGADELIESIGDPLRSGKGDRLVVASVAAHGVGRNLQAFKNQLVVEWPRDETLAEQFLARVHRTGQEMDEVVVHTMISTEWDHVNRAATISDAIYVDLTTGAPRRVLYCDYTEIPAVFPPGHLRAYGAAPVSMSAQVWAETRRRFQ